METEQRPPEDPETELARERERQQQERLRQQRETQAPAEEIEVPLGELEPTQPEEPSVE